MKTLKFLLAGAVALMALSGCSDDVEEPFNPNQEDNQNQENNQESEYDEAYYAKNASVSCSDPNFTVTDDGVVVSFRVSGGEITMDVDCGTDWTAQNSAEDIFTCSIRSTSITITAGQNLIGDELTGTITLITMPSQIEFATITVTQDGLAHLTLSDEELLLSNSEGSISVAVESNFEWTYNCDADWVTIEKDEEKSSMKITYTANATGIDRETVVTITAGDGASNVAEAELKVTQSWENIDALILEYTITDNGGSISLPISYTGSITVDWDDGTPTSSTIYHNYSTPGIYTVTITVNGIISAFSSFYETTAKEGSEYLTAVKQWGRNCHPSSMRYAFRGCKNLVSLPDGADVFSNVTNFYLAFSRCSSLTTIPENLFMNCTAATTFYGMFHSCASLTSAPSFEGCSSATTFESAFDGCTSLTTVPENMFSGCTAVTTFYQTFYACSSLISAPSFEGCSNITSFYECFRNCSSLTTVPENMFSGCTAVTTFGYTFYGCSSLISAPSFEGCSNITSFYECFRNCSSLTAVPENMFSGCTAVTNFGYTFYGCSALKTIPVCLFDDTFSVTSFNYTFQGCSSVVGESPYTELEVTEEKVKVHLYERSNYAVEMRFTIPTGYSGCFKNSTFSDIDSIPSDWK